MSSMIAPKEKKYGYNPSPKLSANQLAEYLIATPARRKSILKGAKYPSTVVVARYRTAKKSIQKHLSDKARSHVFFSEAIQQLLTRNDSKDATKWTKNDCRLSIES